MFGETGSIPAPLCVGDGHTGRMDELEQTATHYLQRSGPTSGPDRPKFAVPESGTPWPMPTRVHRSGDGVPGREYMHYYLLLVMAMAMASYELQSVSNQG